MSETDINATVNVTEDIYADVDSTAMSAAVIDDGDSIVVPAEVDFGHTLDTELEDDDLIDVPVDESVGIAGDHRVLLHRDAPNQHPISAITGLNDALADIDTALSSRISQVEAETAELDVDMAGALLRIGDLQDQVDGNITTWFYAAEPAMNLPPVAYDPSNPHDTGWDTIDKKNAHRGDLYYNTLTGYAYRFAYADGDYGWMRITDTDVVKALADAAHAQDTADSKRRVFYTTPYPPYDKGDLWVQGSTGDILVCNTDKPAGGTYDFADWARASKYTDDTVADIALASANGKNTVYHQASQPTGGTYKKGDTWFDTDDDYTMYTYDGSLWVKEQFGNEAIADLSISNAKIQNATIEYGKIKSVDAGKITVGDLAADRIKASVITAVNGSTETSGGSSLKISADKVNIEGAAIFTSGRLSETSLDNAYDANGAAADALSDAQSYADTAVSGKANKTDAVARQQRIYYRKTASGAPSKNTTWLTTSGTGYGNWSLKIPQMTSGTTKYPYLYTAVQTQTVSQKAAGNTCTCSDVLLDDTTTVIDGGTIITGTVNANAVNASSGTFDTANIPNLNASKITAGDISADRMKVNSISAINSNTGTVQIAASKVDIAGAAVFNNYSTTSQMNTAIGNAVDAKKSIWTINSNYSQPYATILGWSAEGYAADINPVVGGVPDGLKVGDTCRVKMQVSDMNNAEVYLVMTVTEKTSTTRLKGTSHGLDTTVIDGGNILANSIGANQIKANSIITSKLAVKDLTDYVQLNEYTASSYGFTKINDSSNPSAPWYQMNTLVRDRYVSDWYDCQGGESFRVAMAISSNVQGSQTNGGTTLTYLKVGMLINYQNAAGTNNWAVWNPVTSSSAATEAYNSTALKIGDDAVRFRVGVHIEGYNNGVAFSGTYKVRKFSCFKMANSELIVDGSITADHLAANSITVGDMNQDAKDKVLNSNIKLGGRNLLPNSGSPIGYYNFTGAGVAKDSWTNMGWDSSEKASYVTYTGTGATMVGQLGFISEKLVAGDTYTLSGDIKVVSTNSLQVGAQWRDQANVTVSLGVAHATTDSNNAWKHFTITTTFPTSVSTTDVRITFIKSGTTSASWTVYLKNIKLEKGNKETDWSPAPEDEVGRNLLSYPYLRDVLSGSSYTTVGITYTLNDDGTITAKGTATGSAWYQFTSNLYPNNPNGAFCLPAGTYTISGCPSGGAGSSYHIQLVAYNGTASSSTAFASASDYGNGATIVMNQAGYMRFEIGISNGYACPSAGITFKPMLEVGATRHSFVSPSATEAASQSATKYVTRIDDTGIKIHPSNRSGNDHLQLTSTSIDFVRNNVSMLAMTDSDVRVGKSDSNHIRVNNSGMTVYTGTESDSTNVAFYGDNARVGKSATRHIEVKDGGLQVYQDASTVMAHIGYGSGNAESGTANAPYFTFGKRKANSSVGNYSAVLGTDTEASGYCSYAIGFGAQATANYSIAIGDYALSEAESGVAIGAATVARSQQVVVGYNNVPDDDKFFIVGGGLTTVPYNVLTVDRAGNLDLPRSGATYKINGTSIVDFVVAQAVSGDNRYRKWNSGIAECWIYTTKNVAINNAYGSLYQGTWTWTFPTAVGFTDAPTVTCSHFKWGTGASWGTVSASTTTNATLRGIDAVTRASGSCVIAAYAIGKWK